MTLRSGLIPNLNPPDGSGLRDGLNVGDVPAEILANFDYSAPVVAFDFSSAFADNEWLMQDHTAGAFVNNIGSATMDNNGGLTDQTAVGLRTASSFTARDAWEGSTKTEYLICSDTTVGDPNGSDFCVRVVLRVNSAEIDGYVVS